MHITLDSRNLLSRFFLLTPAFLVLSSLAFPQAKPPIDRTLARGTGQSAQQAVQVPFEPILRDENGHPIQPVREQGSADADVHPLSPNARKEKALADSHKAPIIKKPAPTFLGPGQSALLAAHRTSANAQSPASGKPNSSASASSGSFPALGDDGPFPPDVAMAAGPNEVVLAVNTVVNVYDKLGNQLGSSQFGGFYKKLGVIASSSWKIFDPVVHYDEYIQRFWLVTAAFDAATQQSNILVALSNSPDAESGWSLFTVNMGLDANSPSGHWCDFPQFGFDTQAIYFSCDMFSFPPASGSFQYGKVRIMSKSQFQKNTCCNWYDQWKLPWVVQPAIMRHAKVSDGEYLVDAASNNDSDSQTGGGDSGDTLDVWHFPDPLGNPSEMDQTTVSISGYYTPPSATQPGPNLIDTGDARLLSAVWQDGHLSTTQTTLCGSNACAAFYEMDVSSFPSVSVVNDWAQQLAGIDYYFPSVDENANSDKMFIFTTSAGDQFASAAYEGIPNFKKCLHCVGAPEGLLAGGTAQYSNFDGTGRNRWGDYLSGSGDPDGVGVWIAGEFVSGTNQWSAQFGNFYNTYEPKLSVSPTSIDFSDTSSGSSLDRDVTVTNTGNADLTINSVTLSGSSEFSISFNNCRTGGTLPAGTLEAKQSCTVKVALNPAGGGEQKATLSICSSVTTPCLVPTTVALSFNGPVISKIVPNNGPLVGGAVTVSGDALSDKFTFSFGSKPATGVSCPTATTCTMTAPAEGAGSVDVVAKSGALSTAISPSDRFTYQAPAITKIDPAIGPTTGGQSVALTGVGFYPLMVVKFGSTTATTTNGGIVTTTVSCPSDTSCFVGSPAGTGTVHITATLSGVTSTASAADLYTYAIFPSIGSLSAYSGPVTGGISVTITGTNFSTAPGGTIIKFGSLDPTGVTCASSTQCTVTAPARAAGSGFLVTPVTATVNGHTSLGSVNFSFGTRPPPPPKPPCKGTGCS
jgi:hypothetical protein